MYCKCGNIIPKARVKLGYKSCVKCSEEEKWSCNPLTFHKTGNTIEIIKDRELAMEVAAKASRPNYGVMKGVTGNYHKNPNTINKPKKIETESEKEFIVVRSRKKVDPSTYEFDAVGQEAFLMAEKNKSISEIESYLADQVQKIRISPQQKKQIIKILTYETLHS